VYGNSLVINGTTPYVGNFYIINSLNLKTFTASGWFLPTLTNTNCAFFEFEDTIYYQNYKASSGRYYFPSSFSSPVIATTGVGVSISPLTNVKLTTGTWCHFAMTLDSSGILSAYFNGQPVGTPRQQYQTTVVTTLTSLVTVPAGTSGQIYTGLTLPVASVSNFSTSQVGYSSNVYISPILNNCWVTSIGANSVTVSYNLNTAGGGTISSGTLLSSNLQVGNPLTTTAYSNPIYQLGIGFANYQFIQSNVQVADFRIYNQVLNPAQILGVYQSRGIPPSLTITQSTQNPLLLWSFNGSLTDSVQGLTMTGTPTYAQGLYGSSLQVVNTNSYSVFPPSNIFTTNSLTVSGWGKIITGGGGPAGQNQKLQVFQLVSSVNNTVGNSNPLIVAIGFYNGWKPSYLYNDPGFGYRETDANFAASLNTWYHFCVVIGGSSNKNMYFYVNGQLLTGISLGANPQAYTTDMSGLTAFNQVSLYGVSNNTFSVSDCRIYGTALTSSQVQGIYQSSSMYPSLAATQSYIIANPSLLWPFNGSNVDSVTNLSPSATNILSGITYVPGIYNQCINLAGPANSGNPSYLRYTIPTFVPTTSPVTIMCWVNSRGPSVTNESFIGFSATGSGTSDNFNLYFASTSIFSIYSGKDSNGISSSLKFTQGIWFHAAIVFNGSAVVSGYFNGINFGGTFTTTNNLNIQYLFVGCTNGFYGFNGSIQDLRVYNTALTAAQIKIIYQSSSLASSVSII